MIDTKALRSKVLDLAIQGKLTEQLESDGTAEELFAQIQEEKQKLIKEGKIKATLELPTVTDEEKLFDVPVNWKWTHFGNIAYIVRGGSPRPIKQYITNDINGINWIKIGDVEKGGKYIFNTREKIIPEGEKKSRRVYPGDFLLTNSMSFGRPYISKIEGCIHDGWLLIRNLNGFNADYLYYLLSSSYLYAQFCNKAVGATVDNLNIEKVCSALIPLPPQAEQKRIVERVEEIFKLLDIIDEAQKKYSADAEILKSKLITMGIQGKLTKQLDSDGTAEELYQQIQEEKQKLIKEGKIKKEKALQPVADEEIPFEIPSNWRWCRFGEILNIVSAKRVHQSDWQTSGVPFYRAREISKLCENGYVNNDLYISEELYKEYSKFGIPKAGDLVISAVGTLGKSYIVKETDKFYYKDASVLCIENIGKISSVFLSYILKSEMMKKQIKSNSTGTTVDTLTMIKLIQYYIPLPPLTEQKRIAHVLDEVLRVIG